MKRKWIIIVTLLCFSILQVGYQASRPQKVTKLGYINHFNIKTQTLGFDEVEWVSLQNTKRIKELHLNTERDMPDGFYIYNYNKRLVNYKVNDKTVYQLLNREDLSKFVNVKIKEFSKYLKADKFNGIPYIITVQKGNLLVVKEHYVP
jgi:hypothetical protein